MKRIFFGILVLTLVGLWIRPSMAQTITLRLGHVGFPGSLFAITTDEYAKRVNAALKGKVEIKVFHSSQLGSDEQMMRGIKVGAPEMVAPSTVMSTVDAKFGVFEMPYLIVNRAHMKKVAENKQVQDQLFSGLPAKGIRVLGVWENGFRHITNNVRPIVKPDDLKGIKLRVPGGVWRVKMFKEYGANPSPMPLAEVYSALQSGVMDAQENPFPTNCLCEISGGTKISLVERPRLHSCLPGGGRRGPGQSCRKTSRTRSRRSPGRWETLPALKASGWIKN